MATTDDIKNGRTFETIFSANPKKESPFRFRATRLNAARSPKVILCDDPRIQIGKRCRVRIRSIKRPESRTNGHIEVDYLGQVSFRIDDGHYIEPFVSMTLQAQLERGMNILLDGPQGSGKTVLSRKIAEALDLKYVFFNCSSIHETTDFVATLQLRATAAGQAETVWVKTDILRALEHALEHPDEQYLVFLDEFNRCREQARNGIMPALDSTRKLYNPLTGSTVDIPDNILWIAAINNGSQFTGTTNVDPAQLDRFSPLKMSYPPENEEIRILADRHPGVAPKHVRRIVCAANGVRKAQDLGVDLSMRATDEICALVSHPNFAEYDGDVVRELMKNSFCGRFLGRWDDASSEAGLVWEVIVRTLEL